MSMTFGTKAETLAGLASCGFPVPPLMYFEAADWAVAPDGILLEIQARYGECPYLAVRSSSSSEDGMECSRAGAFQSVLHVPGSEPEALIRAINMVSNALNNGTDQIFIQPMVENVAMSGVIMTRVLDDGSPYYVINYDDVSGRTDTITSGTGISKTVYIYKGAREDDFDSPRLLAVVGLAQRLEEVFEGAPLDIEFALDNAEQVHLLQVRRICTERHWIAGIGEKVSQRIRHVEDFIYQSIGTRHGLFGRKTILGVMPDWNPAEMIGVSPRPLAFSLYRELITRRAWSRARAMMGYRQLSPVELMVSVSGRPYIDVRASFNSFLPHGLAGNICEKLVNAWIDRLDRHPNFHDKVEFDIVHTVAEPDFTQSFAERYPGLLNGSEMLEYRRALLEVANAALRPLSTLNEALNDIETLRRKQEQWSEEPQSIFDCVSHLAGLMDECLNLGTLPFAIVARHAFIAEAMLRSAVRMGALRPERVEIFKRSIRTVSGDMTAAFRQVCGGERGKENFLREYGHLRPGTYDILSPSYAERADLFENASAHEAVEPEQFSPNAAEEQALGNLLKGGGINITARGLLDYARNAVAGREYAKFIFTRHVSRILDTLALWGEKMGLSREEVSFLPVNDVLDSLSTPLPAEGGKYFRDRGREYQARYELERTFKLSYIIRSPRDVYIVPQHRSAPNFITSKRISAPVLYLDARSEGSRELEGHIVCIESADPGYDWIFTRNIAGLITRYGGTNSHMAIRCAEYGLPAAIGCGDVLFERAGKAASCLLDCQGKTVVPLSELRDDICI